MPDHNFVETYSWGIIVDTPFGPVIRTNAELEAIEKEVASIDFDNFFRPEEHEVPNISTLLTQDGWVPYNYDGVVDRKYIPTLKALKKEWTTELNLILARSKKIDEYWDKRRGLTDAQKKEKAEIMKMLYVDFFADQVRKKLERVERVLMFAGRPKNTDGALKVEQAKQYPISSLLKFNGGGFACCVWHNEKTPSMKYYKKENRVYCFGCNRGGDAIDVAQVVHGCSFEEAVKRLAP